MHEIATVILAAGEGKRMPSTTPKVLQPLCGRSMIDYSILLANRVGANPVFVVTPPKKIHPLYAHLKNFPKIRTVAQSKPLGTGNAVLSCASKLNGFGGHILILYGDDPLLTETTLKNFLAKVKECGATLGFVTAKLTDPTGYGRVIRNGAGEVVRVVEERETTPEEKKMREANTGIYAARADWLFPTLKKLKPHPFTKEYYLTDIVEEAVKDGEKLLGFLGEDEEEFLGVNSKKHLAAAEAVLRGRLIDGWMSKGVTFVDPHHVYVDADCVIGPETVIHPQVHLRGKTRIGKNCLIECGALLRDVRVGDGVHIKPYCVLEGCAIFASARIGPFARIRPGSVVGKKASIGNFVELKKAVLGERVKANHLTYLGDAQIGAETNIGCGTITCNYDGVKKHPTRIGKKVFVGSAVQFVAPVKIGDGAVIGAGSTVTEDVPAGALAIARGRQVNKKGWAKKRKR